MKIRSWREIRARKFSPDKLEEIDQAVVEESWIAGAQRRADDLATGQTKAVSAEKALRRARGRVT